jgi:cyanophycinase-like exopeptidase
MVANAAGVVSAEEAAVFADPDVTDLAGEFAATVNWGDGTAPDSTAVVVGSGGLFHVVGSHTYANPGLYPVEVELSQRWDDARPALRLEASAWVPGTLGMLQSPVVAKPDNYSVIHGQTLNVPGLQKRPWGMVDYGLLRNDYDPLLPGVRPKVLRWTQPKLGTLTVNPDGSFRYVPKKGMWPEGKPVTDDFWYVDSDATGRRLSLPTKVTITQGYAGFGNINVDAHVSSKGGYVFAGGGSETKFPAAFWWMMEHARGGDMAIIRSSSDDVTDLPSWLWNSLGGKDAMNSITQYVISTPEQARNPEIVKRLMQAEAIYIAGGDQSRYIDLWTGTDIQGTLQRAIYSGKVVLGGTSAGLAILGDAVYYNPPGTSVTSRQALADPYNSLMRFSRDFVHIGLLKNTITDTHFDPDTGHDPDGRLGRSVAFLARMMQPAAGGPPALGGATAQGLGVAANTAVEVELDGRAHVVGTGVGAYFLVAPGAAQVASPGRPLLYLNVPVRYIPSREGPWFSLTDAWDPKKRGLGKLYHVSALFGHLISFDNPWLY